MVGLVAFPTSFAGLQVIPTTWVVADDQDHVLTVSISQIPALQASQQ